MSKVLRAYFIWPAFPSISITGTSCLLSCKHCSKVYLKHMNNANRPEKLVEMCKVFKEKGVNGVLLSGGCDTSGCLLNLEKFLPAIKEVHEMGHIIKLHTGLCDERLAGLVVDTGVDIVSQEIVGDPMTVKEIFGLDVGAKVYFNTFRYLQEAGVPHLCPHLCVGLHRGKLRGELRALELMRDTFVPSSLAIIVFRPTRGTQLENVCAPSPDDLGVVVRTARQMFPDTKLILGAMRPRSSTRNDPNKNVRVALEKAALENGIDGIEIPSREIMVTARKNGQKIKRVDAYGVLPLEYENRVKTSWV